MAEEEGQGAARANVEKAQVAFGKAIVPLAEERSEKSKKSGGSKQSQMNATGEIGGKTPMERTPSMMGLGDI